MTNFKNPEAGELVYVLDEEAMKFAPSSKFLDQEVFLALYPMRLPQKLNYIFKYLVPLQMPEVEAVALMTKYPGRLTLTDAEGKSVEINSEYEREEDPQYKPDELKRVDLILLCKRLELYIPPTPKNVLLIDIAHKALIAGQKPLTIEGYEQLLADEKEQKAKELAEFREKQKTEGQKELAEAQEG